MSKALDYLYRMKEANEEMGYEAVNINEAIEELEELQNRSCKNCKYATLDSSRYLPIHKCSTGCNGIDYDFCCNRWESK
ncbi:hypothetical protein [Aliarcobacter cryaerophilus]|uniref:hypothetical protein n=1 Tax=Aliarcobacter cryaerophilus TaxID=28198 RepID=UPI00165420D2|nr:hypothetical protein [Aliarcobacter cryaerophilus]QNM87321.1 hypothetical protein HOO41_06085 [Aliarcobacter cryaerophilus]